MQEGPDARYLKMIAGLKHYDAYSLEFARGSFIPNISTFDLWDSYLPQYRMAFSADGGNAQAVMCRCVLNQRGLLPLPSSRSPCSNPPLRSYSGVNGVPSCANNYLLNEVMRGAWGRSDAVVVTDCGAISNMINGNHYASSSEDAAAKTLNGGTDIDMGDNFFAPTLNGGNGALATALAKGLTTAARVDAAVTRILTARMHTGLFDPLAEQPYSQIGPEAINSTEHHAANLEMALQSLVLLQNRGGVLPFASTPGKRLAVIGPHVSSTRDLCEDYMGDQTCFGEKREGYLLCVCVCGLPERSSALTPPSPLGDRRRVWLHPHHQRSVFHFLCGLHHGRAGLRLHRLERQRPAGGGGGGRGRGFRRAGSRHWQRPGA